VSPEDLNGSSGAGLTGLELARTIDDCVGDRVLVFGSPPPHGGDLDLLARAPELSVIARRLGREGFVRRGLKWAHFSGCTVLSVDLVPAEHWGLAHAELRILFAEADPLDGFSSLVLPSPYHQILIAARRAARAGGTLDERSRARVEQALAHDPGAWGRAEQRAPMWNASAAMRLLRMLWRTPGGDRGALKTAARLEFALSVARAPGGWRRLALRGLRPRRPAVIAFSGLDGAGKSFQANALQESLSHLGVEAFVVWPPAQNVLFQMPSAVKSTLHAVLKRLGRRGGGTATGVETSSELAGGAESPGSSPGAPTGDGDEPVFPDLPSQQPLVMHLLATIVALVQVLSFRAGMRSAPGHPRVVIFDRYTLDAIVYARHRWGHGHPLRLQCWLIRALARRPLRAYLLEVAPEVAYARKRDFPLENLRGRANLYREHWQALGARRLDGERPRADLREEIARDVWSLLG
jgi:thymidylate kinase